MYAFSYHRPRSLAEALDLLRGAGDPKLLAGGQTLLPTMKQRLASPTDLIDIGRLDEIKGLTEDGATVIVGAGETHAAVAGSRTVAKLCPGLAALAGQIGDPHVRHMGTLGGSIANNDPSADYPAACLALNAVIHTSKRALPADEFFTGMFETALEVDEVVTQVVFPAAEKSAYAKFPNPASRYALVGVFVAVVKGVPRVAVTGAGSAVFRVLEMEEALTRSFAPQVIASIRVPSDDLNSDIHADAVYRAHLVTVMAKRAVVAAG